MSDKADYERNLLGGAYSQSGRFTCSQTGSSPAGFSLRWSAQILNVMKWKFWCREARGRLHLQELDKHLRERLSQEQKPNCQHVVYRDIKLRQEITRPPSL